MSKWRRERQAERRQRVRAYAQGAGAPDDLRKNLRSGSHWVVFVAGMTEADSVRLAQDLADGGRRVSWPSQVAWLDLPSGHAVLLLVPRSAVPFKAVLDGLGAGSKWSAEAEAAGMLALARPEVLPKALAELDAVIGDGEQLVAGEVLVPAGKVGAG